MKTLLLAAALVLGLSQTVPAQMGANLVPPSSATDVAKTSGSWQEPSTWTDNTVPVAGEKVYIPNGITVTNHAATADVLWIHVAGTLTCCDHCNTKFNVHTLYVPMNGSLRLHSTGSCTVEWLSGPFLPGDTTKLSRGLICHGDFMGDGKPKTAWGPVVNELPIGATSLTVSSASGWSVGDKLVICGTDVYRVAMGNAFYEPYQSEFVTVTGTLAASDGVNVTFTPPLKYRHFRWKPDLPFHVGNLTRNVVFRSRDPDTIDNRGHLMFMSSMHRMLNVAVEGCGRSDGSRPITDPRTDLYGDLIPGSDANVRARYAIHWHRIGQLSSPAICKGCVVDGSPKWGFLIHDSVAHVTDCIATHCYGSGFATEEGQERGSFVRCLSVLNRGLGDTPGISSDDDHGREDIGDWGIDGSGFWLQGGGVDVRDCVAVDNSGRGFALHNRTLNGYPNYGGHVSQVPWIRYPIDTHGTLLPVEYDGVTTIPSSSVPQRVFSGNTAYMNKIGLQGWSGPTYNSSSQPIWPLSVRGNITNLTIWGRGAKLHLEYMRQVNVNGLRIQGDNHFRSIHQTINGQAEAVLLRGLEVTITNHNVTDVQFRMAEFSVAGANDPGGIAAKNISIQGRTVQPTGAVTNP